MIYIVRLVWAYSGESIKCATADLSFANEVYDKVLDRCDLNDPSYEWVDLICLDEKINYDSYAKNYDTIKTSHIEKKVSI